MTTTTTTTNDTQQQQDVNLSVTITNEQTEASLAEQQFFSLITVNAPAYESEERGSRAPIDIVCVIDKSGSMAGEKMELMKKTLLFMIEQLKSMDRLSLVLFDTSVETAFKSLSMDSLGKERATSIVNNIRDGSSTNLSGGLLEGLQVVKERVNPSDVASVLLFTDGLANHGITNSAQIVTAVHKSMEEMSKPVSVFTFGFGKDHDANMLNAISQAGNGLYYFLENVDAIPETFGDCLGGLLSVIAQNIKIKFEVVDDNGCQITKIHSSYKQNVITPNKEIELVLGDIYSEEKKNIVFEIKLPLLRAPLEIQNTVKVTVTYFNVITTESKSEVLCSSISRVSQVAANKTPNLLLDKQRNRVNCSDAMDKARTLGNGNQLEEARRMLNVAIEEIKKSASANDDFCKGLVQDLQDCLSDMQDRTSYQQLASKKLNNYWASSHQERSTNAKSSAQASYATNFKMKKKAEAINRMLQ